MNPLTELTRRVASFDKDDAKIVCYTDSFGNVQSKVVWEYASTQLTGNWLTDFLRRVFGKQTTVYQLGFITYRATGNTRLTSFRLSMRWTGEWEYIAADEINHQIVDEFEAWMNQIVRTEYNALNKFV